MDKSKPLSASLPTPMTASQDKSNTQDTTRSGLNPSAPGIPYYTPAHAIPPGTALPSQKSIPTLFKPLTIRGKTLKNRIIVSPMCQYSTAPDGPEIGCLTPYHIATLGHYAIKGAALVFIEATAVQPCGRISPNCPGLWFDAQIKGIRSVADFVHSQGALVGIQLAHAGRKASTLAPWVASSVAGAAGSFLKYGARAMKDVGGWGEGGVVGPMGGPEWTWDGKPNSDPSGKFWEPKALNEDELKDLVEDWKASAIRAVEAGVDVIEIHGAHGYLIHQFLSPVTNRRIDSYGGSFKNRTRLLRQIVTGIRSVIPDDMPVFVRLSSTDWLEGSEVEKKAGGSWDVKSTTRVALSLPDWGADLFDVSSAGLIKRELKKEDKKLFIGAVGLITEAEQARILVEESQVDDKDLAPFNIAKEAEVARDLTDDKDGKEQKADVVLIARQFMREPEWVLRVAANLDVDVAWPSQFMRVRFPKL